MTATVPAGIAVDMAARVASTAAPGEVLMSRTVGGLVVGSRIASRTRHHDLEGGSLDGS